MSDVAELVMAHEGEWTAEEIAEEAGVSVERVWKVASLLGKSVRVATKVPKTASIHYCRVPVGQEAEYAEYLNAIQREFSVRSKSAAINLAVKAKGLEALAIEEARATNEGTTTLQTQEIVLDQP